MSTPTMHSDPGWAFPEGLGERVPDDPSKDHQADEPVQTETRSFPKVFPTRRCRFCYADVNPTVEIPSSAVPSFFQPLPRVSYVDPDPDLGELIKPCLCKGTRRYIHEGCLQEMRAGMMRARGANWERYCHECDICRFKYRFERMWFARAISSRINQFLLTVFILFLITFALGFAADPIINLYLDPYTTVSNKEFLAPNTVEIELAEFPESWWLQHFAKGFASVGILSVVNVLATITSPFQWWSLRNTFLQGSGRPGTTGRERVASISWLVLLVGVVTALWKLYQLTHYFTARYLLKVSDRVRNVNLEDDDEDIKMVIEHEKSE